MKHTFFVLLCSMFWTVAGFGQEVLPSGGAQCALGKSSRPVASMNEIARSGSGHSFDVLNYKLSLNLLANFSAPYPHSFAASEIITLKADSVLNSISLNAVNSSIKIDSVKINAASFSHLSNILTLKLDKSYNPGDTLNVEIFYQHKDVNDYAFYVSKGQVFTDCEPEGARNWFPCWDKPSDKATVDITVRTPVNVKLGSTGSLKDSINTGSEIYYHWVSRDPVATYLVVITASPDYNLDIVYWQNPEKPGEKVPFRFYWKNGESVTNVKNIENKILAIMTYFSKIFGPHPFEKNGFASLNSTFQWGGMENQTLTTICPNCWDESLIVHEFAHQWFGDMISPGSWADVWLNEGFATYCEHLWTEHSAGMRTAKLNIVSEANYYMSNHPSSEWPIYNPAWAVITPSTNTLFNTSITYYKSSSVLYMLRYVLGDSTFFSTLKAYASDSVNFRYKNITTTDFRHTINGLTGLDLNWFFDEWLDYPYLPVYENTYSVYQNAEHTWNLQLYVNQVQKNAPFFSMPLTLRIGFLSGRDTTVSFFNKKNSQTFIFTFPEKPGSVVFDPDNNIILKTATLTERLVDVAGYKNAPQDFELLQNYPNPFNPSTTISYILPAAGEARLVIYNSIGQLVDQMPAIRQQSGVHQWEWNCSSAASGIYFYSLDFYSDDGKQIFKTVKKMTVLK